MTDAPIPLQDDAEIFKKWKEKHDVVLPDSHLLIANQQEKLWRDFGLETPQISVWLAESLRTRACVKPVAGLQLAVIPGRAAEGIEVIADCVGKSFEVYIRVRAFFYTLLT